MRILLINRFFGPATSPTGRMLFDVALELVKRGHAVTVLTSNACYAKPSEHCSHVCSGVRTIEVKTLRKSRILNWAVFWLSALLAVCLGKWDRCVILTDPPFMLVGAWCRRLFKRKQCPIFWWTMDLYPEALEAAGMLERGHWLFRLLSCLNEVGLSATDGVIALGAQQKRILARYKRWCFDKPFCIVVPPWDARPIHSVPMDRNLIRRRFGWGSRKIALYAGNLGKGHSFGEILAAAAYFRHEDRNDWLFVISTHGEQRARLAPQAESLPNVSIIDYVAEAETSALLSAATVHVVTMRPGWEGIIVPSKTYSCLRTRAPILYVGPVTSDTAHEIMLLKHGLVLPTGTPGSKIAKALDELSRPEWIHEPHNAFSGPWRIVDFVTANSS